MTSIVYVLQVSADNPQQYEAVVAGRVVNLGEYHTDTILSKRDLAVVLNNKLHTVCAFDGMTL